MVREAYQRGDVRVAGLVADQAVHLLARPPVGGVPRRLRAQLDHLGAFLEENPAEAKRIMLHASRAFIRIMNRMRAASGTGYCAIIGPRSCRRRMCRRSAASIACRYASTALSPTSFSSGGVDQPWSVVNARFLERGWGRVRLGSTADWLASLP